MDLACQVFWASQVYKSWSTLANYIQLINLSKKDLWGCFIQCLSNGLVEYDARTLIATQIPSFFTHATQGDWGLESCWQTQSHSKIALSFLCCPHATRQRVQFSCFSTGICTNLLTPFTACLPTAFALHQTFLLSCVTLWKCKGSWETGCEWS